MNVIVYYKTGCPYAQSVMEFLQEKEIPFEERDVNLNPAFEREVMEKSGKNKSPTLDIDGHILADVDAREVADYLDKLQPHRG